MSLEMFDAHLRDAAPGFRCYSAGDRSKKLNFLARVTNVVGNPGAAKSVAAVSKTCGASLPALNRFVELYDGVLLYQDDKSDAAGIEFFKATEWQSRTKEMHESMAAMGVNNDEMPDWFRRGVVFGEIPHSANYFVIQPSGDETGQVFYCDHDDFKADPIAPSYEDFLAMIVRDPAAFLYNCGCYTRYSDGKTNIQWIPTVYITDCRGN